MPFFPGDFPGGLRALARRNLAEERGENLDRQRRFTLRTGGEIRPVEHAVQQRRLALGAGERRIHGSLVDHAGVADVVVQRAFFFVEAGDEVADQAGERAQHFCKYRPNARA